MKNGKKPFKKWRSYNVKPVSEKVFDSLEKALKAEKLLQDQSNIESSDIDGEGSREVQHTSKRFSKPISKCVDGEESSSNDEGGPDADSIRNPPSVHSNSPNERNMFSSLDMNYDEPLDGISETNNIQMLATEFQASEIIKLLKQQNMKLDLIINSLTTMKATASFAKNDIVEDWKGEIHFPLKSVEEIKRLEEIFKEKPERVQQFHTMLSSLGGDSLKAVIKFIIKKVYDLDVQDKINYSGREQKFRMADLKQTNVIIEVMKNGVKDAKYSDAYSEYRYHLQHSGDRIKTNQRKRQRMAEFD